MKKAKIEGYKIEFSPDIPPELVFFSEIISLVRQLLEWSEKEEKDEYGYTPWIRIKDLDERKVYSIRNALYAFSYTDLHMKVQTKIHRYTNENNKSRLDLYIRYWFAR